MGFIAALLRNDTLFVPLLNKKRKSGINKEASINKYNNGAHLAAARKITFIIRAAQLTA